MVNITDTHIEFYLPVSEITKALHNQTAYLSRKFGYAVKSFQDEDKVYFDELFKKASPKIVRETFRYSKSIVNRVKVAEHIKANEGCVIYYIQPEISNTEVLEYVDDELWSALKESLVYQWFSGTQLEVFAKENMDTAVRNFKSAILNLKVTGQYGRGSSWL